MTAPQERRQAMRTAILERASALVPAAVEVWLLDLSATGARIEHGQLLQPGAACTLELPARLGSLRLPGRVVWSGMLGREDAGEGGGRLRRQSGLVFTAIGADQQAVLTGVLEKIRAGTVGRS